MMEMDEKGGDFPSPPIAPISPAAQFSSNFPVFRNQVAGHHPLLWHSGTICKPLIPAEYDFYSSLDQMLPDLIPYCAKYYGVLDLDSLNAQLSRPTQEENKKEKLIKHDKTNSEDQSNTLIDPSGSPQLISSPSAGRPHSSAPLDSQSQYLVLEDLTFPFLKPCILDIKIGTRQHSDNESAAKIARKTARCQNTTSSSLGMRICGVQFYWPASDEFSYKDKHFGRGLDVAGFKGALKEFFYVGGRLLVERMLPLLQRLLGFRKALLSENSCNWRFYSASLLIIYEGKPSDEAGTIKGNSDDFPSLSRQSSENLEALLVESKSLEAMKFSASADFSSPTSPTSSTSFNSPSGSPAVSLSPTSFVDLKSKATNNIAAEKKSQGPMKIYSKKRKTTQIQARERARLKGFVDCRMIDFAHTSRSSVPIGVDPGVIFGFTNLIQLLAQIIEEATISRPDRA